MSKRSEIAKIVTALAEYYNQSITQNQILMYVEEYADMEITLLMQAIRLYKKDPSCDFFPRPEKLKSMVILNDEQLGRDAAASIRSAIAKFGPYRTCEALRWMGTLGEAVCASQGGFEEICKTATNENLPTLQAQWRELGIAILKKDRLGIMDQKPQLSNQSKQNDKIEQVDFNKLMDNLLMEKAT